MSKIKFLLIGILLVFVLISCDDNSVSIADLEGT